METHFKFSIQPLLSLDDSRVSAPMSPFLFIQEVSKQTGLPFNRLARVWIDSDRINQYPTERGYTAHDTLLLATEYANDFLVTLWVDKGESGTPVAMCYRSDRDMLMTQIYEGETFSEKLTVENVRLIFESVFENPFLIAPITNNQQE